MLNVFVPVIENVEGFSDFIQKYDSKDINFFVGIKESLKEKFLLKQKNLEIHVFKNNSNKEEIINSLHTLKMKKGKILVVRRPLTNEEFMQLTNCSDDIVTLKAKHCRFINSIKNLAKSIVKKFFAFSFFEDISAICYGEIMFELLSVCSNFSMASRINKYVGVTHQEIITENKPVKKDYSRWKNSLSLLFWILLFAGSIAGVACVCIFAKIHVLTVILLICWLLVSLAFLLIGIVNFTRTVTVGNLRYGRAEEII